MIIFWIALVYAFLQLDLTVAVVFTMPASTFVGIKTGSPVNITWSNAAGLVSLYLNPVGWLITCTYSPNRWTNRLSPSQATTHAGVNSGMGREQLHPLDSALFPSDGKLFLRYRRCLYNNTSHLSSVYHYKRWNSNLECSARIHGHRV
jgi:hypothetical protein